MAIILQGKFASERLHCLDSIRGIAALVVVLHHCWFLTASNEQDYSLSHSLISVGDFLMYFYAKVEQSGRTAVIIFFTLSGFVLAHSLIKHQSSYKDYIIKRIFRIYPTFLVAVLLSYALHYFIPTSLASYPSGFIQGISNPDLSGTTFVKHIIFWGTIDSIGLNGVIWSLAHEMRISFVFPLLLALTLRYRLWSLALCFLLSLAASFIVISTTGAVEIGITEKSELASYFASLYFIVFFISGILLALSRERLKLWFAKAPKSHKYILAILVFLGFMKVSFTLPSKQVFGLMLSDYLHGAAAAGLITLALTSKTFANFLEYKPFLWLGRVSYSLYLIHIPILYLMNEKFSTMIPATWLTVLVIAASLIAAEVLARLVEYPSITLGKKIVRMTSGK